MATRPPSSRRSALDSISLQPASVRRLPGSPVAGKHDPSALGRIRGEFAEMPGLSLTLAQAARLLGMPKDECLRMLRELVNNGVLRVRIDGRYVLNTSAA